MDRVNKQYGPPLKLDDWKFLESYFKRRIHHEGYRDNKHRIHVFASDRQKIMGMLEHELAIVESEIKRIESDVTNSK